MNNNCLVSLDTARTRYVFPRDARFLSGALHERTILGFSTPSKTVLSLCTLYRMLMQQKTRIELRSSPGHTRGLMLRAAALPSGPPTRALVGAPMKALDLGTAPVIHTKLVLIGSGFIGGVAVPRSNMDVSCME